MKNIFDLVLCISPTLKKLIMELKIAFIIIVVSVSNVLATPTYSQVAKVSLDMENKSLEQVMDEIEKQSEFYFLFNQRHIDVNRVVSVKVENELINPILNQLFQMTDISYSILDKQILLSTFSLDPSEGEEDFVRIIEDPQQTQITGRITDASTGEPLPGVNIVIKGTVIGTLSDVNGNYSLTISDPKDATLVFSFIGYNSQEILVAGRSVVNVTLESGVSSLDEVIVIGYGTQRKATVTGSITAINTEVLMQSPQANLTNALTGRLPGFFSRQQEGTPGSDQPIIRIRGSGTFTGSTDPLVLVDGVESLNYSNIDVNEIDNISILKDASATAVYGVRGANGVIIITTRRGLRGKPVFSASSNLAVTAFANMRANLGSYEWAKNFNEALRYNSYITGSYTPRFSESDLEHFRLGDSPIFHADTDWISLLLKPTSLQTQSNLNVSGGEDNIKYFISIGHFYREGQFNNTKTAEDFDAQVNYNRYNFRSNFDLTMTKRLKADINLSSQLDVTTGPGRNLGYLLGKIYDCPPNNSPGIVDGKVINVYDVFAGNILEMLLGTGWRTQLSNYLTSQVRLNYDLDFITQGLILHGTISYWNRMTNTKTYSKEVQTYHPILLPDNTIIFGPQKEERPFGFSESTSKSRKTYIEIGLNYDRRFGSHNVTGLLLYDQSKLFDPSLEYVIPNGYQGLVGRITYDYARRYMAEFNVGYNGTENFAVGKRFGLFPAFSIGWVVTEEPLFPENNIVTHVKIRGSYGEVGNDKIGSARFLYNPSSFTYGNGYYFGEVGTTYQRYQRSTEGTIGNPVLTWERSKKSNLGVDLNLFGDKITIITDWFVENRDNILATQGTLPNILGVESGTWYGIGAATKFPAQNLGKMKNSGFETDVTYRSNIGGNFSYWLSVNYSKASNMVVFQDEVERAFTYQNRTGQSLDQYFGLIADGFYNTWEEVNDANRPVSSWNNNYIMPGDFRFKDVNGDGIINADDQVPIGYSNFPEIIYGISFGGNYKGLDFSILFQGAGNVSKYTYITSVRPFENNLSCFDYIPDMSWTPERYEQGLYARLPHLSAQQVQIHNFQSSTFMVSDGKYVRLKNVEIGYSFNTALLSRFNINSCRLYLNGSNLLTWHGLYPGDDPEQSSGGDYAPYPNIKIINFGFNIKF